jgi:hypothetical protein
VVQRRQREAAALHRLDALRVHHLLLPTRAHARSSANHTRTDSLARRLFPRTGVFYMYR